MKFLLLILALINASAGRPPAATQSESKLSAETRVGFAHFYNLEYDAAIAQFEKMAAAQPDNPFFQNYLAVALLYRELYRGGALEGDLFGESNRIFAAAKFTPDPGAVARLQRAYDRAIEISEKRLKQNPGDQDALYTLGAAYSTKASYLFVVAHSWFGALRAGTNARKPHQQLVVMNPQYYDAYLIPGVHDYVVGSLPAFVKVLAFLGGFHGDKTRGIQEVQLVAQKGSVNRLDAKILLSVIYRRERRFADARRVLSELVTEFPRNYILPLEMAGLFAKEGNTEAALRQYEEVLAQVRAGAPGYNRVPAARVNYRLGELYERRGDSVNARARYQAVQDSTGATPQLIADARREIEKLDNKK